MKPIKKLFVSAIAFLLGASVASCGGNDAPTKVDYVHNGTCQLSLNYQNVDFFAEGVGEFDLWTCIDGDTAHFKPLVTKTSSNIVKARFYGVDTPESTGRVQPYGKAASNFTKTHLKNAAENGTIVLAGVSSEYAVPSTDGNGRHLVCIWINETQKNAPLDSLVNLNLWLVQEGFSGISSLEDMPEYEPIFLKALAQAKKLKLNMHSGLPDPLYNYGDYNDAYIPDIVKEVHKKIKDPTYVNPYDGEKVRIEGTVVGYSGGTLFLQKYDDPEIINEETGEHGDGKFYTINIFCGMSAIPKKYSKFGTVLKVMGLCSDSDEFGFQVSDVESHFPEIDDEEFVSENDVQILVKAKDNTVDEKIMPHTNYLTANELNQIALAGDLSIFNSPVQLVKTSGDSVALDERGYPVDESRLDPVTVYRCKPNQNNDKWTIKLKDLTYDLYITQSFRGDPSTGKNWNSDEQWKDKKMIISQGIYTYHAFEDKDTGEKTYNYQIIFSSVNGGNLLWLDRPQSN